MASSPPSAGSQGAILAFLFFQLMIPGWCQYGYMSGLCGDCTGHLKQDLTQGQMNYYAHTNTKIRVCPPFIRFKLGKNVTCGKSSEVWVNKLRNCIETKDFQACKIGTTKSVTTAPTSAFVLTTTKGTELTTHHTSTSKNPNFSQKDEHKKTLDPNNDATNETKNDPLAGAELKDELKNSTPPPQTDKTKHLMVAVLSLLAVIVSLVSYVSCRRKVCSPGRNRRPADMKLMRTNMMQ